MTSSPDRDEAPVLLDAVERERREADRARALDELLQRRPDLPGLLPAVDQASESIRWCA